MLLTQSFREVPVAGPTICCIGTFDGVHRGHRHLIGSAVREARLRDMQAAVVTFYPHPRAVLRGVEERYLSLPDEKAVLVSDLDVDVMLVHAFTPDTIQTRADEFTRWMLEAFDMRSLWIGPDFAFGHQREGNVDWLRRAGDRYGFAVNVVDQYVVDGRPSSSSRVRDSLLRGDMQDVTTCLGRTYAISAQLAEDGRHLHLDARRFWPTPGEYAVTVHGKPNRIFLSPTDGADGLLEQIIYSEPYSVVQVNFA